MNINEIQYSCLFRNILKVSNGFFLETERKKRFLTSWNFLQASCIISSGDKAVGKRWGRIRKRGGSRTWKAINRESLRAVQDELLIRRGRRLIVFRSDGNKLFICLVLIRLSMKIHAAVIEEEGEGENEIPLLSFLTNRANNENKKYFWRM